MECLNHQVLAKAICTNCGSGICLECLSKSSDGKYVCSDFCSQAINEFARSETENRKRTEGGLKASAYGSYLCGILMVIFAAFEPALELKIFLGGMGGGLIVMGGLFHRNLLRQKASVNK